MSDPLRGAMSIYYEDDLATLYHGDCLNVLTELPTETVDVLLTDPPYFNVKDDEWDRQWSERAHFLAWLGLALDAATPALKASASIWVFASPLLASTVELEVIAPRFRLLNSIRWVKENGWHQKADIAAQRRYLTAWECIILAEQFDDVYGDAAKALHREVFAPIGRYMQSEWERAGWKAGRLGVALGYDSALPTRWAEGSSLPSLDAYKRMRDLLNDGSGDYLRREYEDLRREYEDLRRPFRLDRKRGPVTDVWNFPTVAPYPGKHPCEKPESLLAHMVTTSSRADDVILDPFAGSGSTLVAAKNLGRKSIGVELDERYCEVAAKRLSQDVLNFGEPA